MSSTITDGLSARTKDKPARRRRRPWITAGVIGVLVVIGLLVVIGVASFSGDSPSAASSSNVSHTSSKTVAAAGAEVAWGARTKSEQADVCALYKVDSATALAAIANGIDGNDRDLLGAFDDLLSRSC